jgi:hypothetical protein
MPFSKQNLKIISLALFISFFTLFGPQFAAARGLVPCGGYEDDAGTVREPDCTIGLIFIMAARVTNWLIGLAGVFAVYQIIAAGFWLAISQGNEETISQKKKALSNAVIGFVMALMAFMFVNTIVNYLLLRAPAKECRLDLTDPLTYLRVEDNPKCKRK